MVGLDVLYDQVVGGAAAEGFDEVGKPVVATTAVYGIDDGNLLCGADEI